MKVVTDESEIAELVDSWKAIGLKAGLVPTMGALHQGHMELVSRAVASCDRAVVSIFLNPKQFGQDEDLERYPGKLEEDCQALEKAGAAAVFAPEAGTVYPEGFSTIVSVSGVTRGLCGAFRPGHFDGVTTVCAVLFQMVRPDVAFFGRKDAQQLAVIRRMVKDLRLGIRIEAVPIVREKDGLAMSSRNTYLSIEERVQAAGIYSGLCLVRAMAADGECRPEALKRVFAEHIGQLPLLRLQYFEIVSPLTMEPVDIAQGAALAAAAVFAGSTRLIDNVIIEPEV